MGIPARRRREIAAKDAAREERFHDQLTELVGLDPASDLFLPHVAAWYSPTGGVVCRRCKRFAGSAPLRISEVGSKPCERCGRRLDHDASR